MRSFFPSDFQTIIFSPISFRDRKTSSKESLEKIPVEENHKRVSGFKFECVTSIEAPSIELADSTAGVAPNAYPIPILALWQ
jgi:hypothetical protein